MQFHALTRLSKCTLYEDSAFLHPGVASTTTPAPEGCQYKGNTYADGAYWTDSAECSSCTCESGHVSCTVTCQEPVEPAGCVNPVRRTDSSGCCQVIVCDSTGKIYSYCLAIVRKALRSRSIQMNELTI